MRVEIEHGLAREFDVPPNAVHVELKRCQCLPNLLVDGEPMGMVEKGVEQPIEGDMVLAGRCEVPCQRKAGTPAQWIPLDQLLAQPN